MGEDPTRLSLKLGGDNVEYLNDEYTETKHNDFSWVRGKDVSFRENGNFKIERYGRSFQL